MMASTPDPASPQGLDPAALGRLRELDPDGSLGVVRRVLQAYETSVERMQVQLQEQLAAGPNAHTVAGIAHTLKSSSASVGAMPLAERCADVEARLRRGEDGTLVQDIAHLLADAQRALQAVGAILRP